jgi:hypothetical protein
MSHIIDSIIVEGIAKTDALSLDLTSTTTSAGTQTLTASSTVQQVYTGSTAGQLVNLPDATTLSNGHTYFFWNESTVSVDIQDATPAAVVTIDASYRAQVTLTDNSTAAGVWIWSLTKETAELKAKAGSVSAGTFAGNPKTATVTFSTAFADANYSVSIVGQDGRSWKYQSKAAGSFVINSQANSALTGAVDWIAVHHGES